MGLEFQLFFEIGIIMFLAFIGVLLTNKFGQSVLLAYILIGVAIGPFGLGIIQSKPTQLDIKAATIQASQVSGMFIYIFSQIGLILLLFFVGLEFSLTKLKKSQKPAVILATFDVAINIFVGIVLGTYYGWPIIDTIFLACIIAMSSVAVTIKILEDLKRAGKPETEVLVSLMIIEDFASIIILTAVSSFVIGAQESSLSLIYVIAGVIVLFVFFIILSFIFIPMIVTRIGKVKNKEAFILFALCLVFLPSALAEFFGIAAIVGAFLMGMGFSGTKLANQLKNELSSWKNAFVAVFFISFGMMIDPRVFSNVGHIILLAVPLTIINEMILLAAIAFIIGMSAEAAVSIGAGTLGRSEEAIIFANVGTNLKTVKGQNILSTNGQRVLAPFAGGFCLIMSAITPILMKWSYNISNFFGRKLPLYVKFGGYLLSRMIKGMVMNINIEKTRKNATLGIMLYLYFILTLVLISIQGISKSIVLFNYPLMIILSIIIIGLILASILIIWHLLSQRLMKIARTMELKDVPLNHEGKIEAVNYTNNCISGSLGVFLIMIILWQIYWQFTIFALLIYLLIIWISTYYIYHRFVGKLQWIAREDLRKSKTQKPIILNERPQMFTYRGESWEQRNPRHKRKR